MRMFAEDLSVSAEKKLRDHAVTFVTDVGSLEGCKKTFLSKSKETNETGQLAEAL